MIDQALKGIADAFSLPVLPWVIAGNIIGLIVGILPGIGGLPTLAMMLPLFYTMPAAPAIALCTSLDSVATTGGALTSILINVPGENANAATCLDGFPLSKQGKAGRAIGAAIFSSTVGGIFGAIVMLVIIPVAYPLVLAFGHAEMFFVMLAGLAFIAVLASKNALRGMISGLFGILLSFIGYTGMTAIPRFTFGSMYLQDNLPMIPLLMGLLAIPSTIEMAITGQAIAANLSDSEIKVAHDWRQVWAGIKDTFHWWKLVVVSSVIGAIVGIIPGIGGSVAQFVAYGQAKQMSKHPEKFGTGVIEGVIAPQSSVNAEKGGAFIPTVTFGIPGSPAMVMFLAIFIIVGLVPGPEMIGQHFDLVFTVIAVLIFSSILGMIILLPLISQIIKLCFVPAAIMVPIIIVFLSLSAFTVNGDFLDVVMTFIFGCIAILMMRYKFDRVIMLLGFLLGVRAEKNLFVALAASGPQFFLRPICLVLLVCIIVIFLSPFLKRKKSEAV